MKSHWKVGQNCYHGYQARHSDVVMYFEKLLDKVQEEQGEKCRLLLPKTSKDRTLWPFLNLDLSKVTHPHEDVSNEGGYRGGMNTKTILETINSNFYNI